MHTTRPASLNIAIDGPAASGKSAVGSEVARRLGIRFLDTGIMYRALTWAAIQRRIDASDHTALSQMAASADIRLEDRNGADRLLFDGEDITEQLRTAEVDANVSAVSAVNGVRTALVAQQRTIASHGAIVMSGRDIATVVLPHADVKVFLTASVEVRAARRHAEQQQSGLPSDYREVLQGLRQRDKIDSEREDSPLRPADDAIRICSDHMTLDEVVLQVLSLVQQTEQR